MVEEGEDCDSDTSDQWDDNRMLGGTLGGEGLARTLVEATTANELRLVKSEVKRLRTKIAALEQEKDDIIDNFRDTSKILLSRIKELESELSDTKSRPATAAVIDRIENRPAGKPPLPQSRGSTSGGSTKKATTPHAPEVLRLDEEPSEAITAVACGVCVSEGAAGGRQSPEHATEKCGNCGRDIPVSNLVSHNIYCYRNSWRCAPCDKVLPLNQKEAHLQQWKDPEKLLAAASNGDVDTLQLMVEHGVDIGSLYHPLTQDSVLHAVVRCGDVELIGFCMGYGAEVDPLNRQGETPLHLAVQWSELRVVKFLVELGADVNRTNGKGEAALMLACRRGVADIAKFLVEMKADAEACTKLGDTPLQVAQRLGHQETVLALCTAGAPLRSGTPKRGRAGAGGTPKRTRSGTPTRLCRA